MSVVRRLQAGDADLLRAVRLSALADAPGAFSSTLEAERDAPLSHWRQRVQESADGQTGVVFAAIDDEGPFAMAGAYLPDEQRDRCVLWGMWVRPRSRRRGVGVKLVDAVVVWARDRGLQSVELSVTDAVPGARAFYVQRGFQPVGAPAPLAEDPSRMETTLTLALPSAAPPA
jgi:GNAT superfamily N-acetyltransferase